MFVALIKFPVFSDGATNASFLIKFIKRQQQQHQQEQQKKKERTYFM